MNRVALFLVCVLVDDVLGAPLPFPRPTTRGAGTYDCYRDGGTTKFARVVLHPDGRADWRYDYFQGGWAPYDNVRWTWERGGVIRVYRQASSGLTWPALYRMTVERVGKDIKLVKVGE